MNEYVRDISTNQRAEIETLVVEVTQSNKRQKVDELSE